MALRVSALVSGSELPWAWRLEQLLALGYELVREPTRAWESVSEQESTWALVRGFLWPRAVGQLLGICSWLN